MYRQQVGTNGSGDVQAHTKRNTKILIPHWGEFFTLTILVTLYFAWLAWPLVWSASENIRLVSVFSADEAVHARLVQEAIEQSTLKLDFYSYGHLYFNVTLLPLLLVNIWQPVSEQQIIITLRLVSTLFGIATVLLTFQLARRYFGRLAAWLAVFLLSIVPLNFIHWSVTSHPDTMQMFFIVLSLYFCCRLAEEGHWRWLVWASAAAGLTFATKYSGLFLLPILWFTATVQTLLEPEGDQIKMSAFRFAQGMRLVMFGLGLFCISGALIVTADFLSDDILFNSPVINFKDLAAFELLRVAIGVVGVGLSLSSLVRLIGAKETISGPISCFNKVIFKIVLSVVIFGVTFFLTSPFSWTGLGFLQGMLYESSRSFFGHEFAANANNLLWLDIILSPQLIDVLVFSLAVVSLGLTLYGFSRQGWPQLLRPDAKWVMWSWVIFYLSFLILRVNLRQPRFVLPVLPLLIILAVWPIAQGVAYVAERSTKRQTFFLTIMITFVIIGLEFPKSIRHILEYKQEIINREQANPVIKSGQWLADHYAPSTRILYDRYSYVPPSFAAAYPLPWAGESTWVLKEIDPDVVIVNQAISARFYDIHQATQYDRGEREFMEKYDYYGGLKHKTLGYLLVRDFGDVQVYEKE